MVLVRKNVQSVGLLKIFHVLKVFVLKVSKDVCFESEKECLFWNWASNYEKSTYSKSLCSFLPFLWYCYLTIDLVRSLIFGYKGTGMGHRIIMIAILWDILAFLFERLRSFERELLIASSRDYELVFLSFFC